MPKYIGKPLKRIIEDPPLVTGRATFVYDLDLRGTLYASFVRSQYAHAKIKSVKCPEGSMCFTSHDLPKAITGIARNEAVYQGQPIAVVLTNDEYKARDLAEEVEVEYEPLPSVIDVEEALSNKERAMSELESNIVLQDEVNVGDIQSDFKRAYKIIEGELINQRVIPSAMEPRGAFAQFDGKRLTVWSSTQTPFDLKKSLSEILSEYGVNDIRVIQPYVGGAFGSKIINYAEEFVVAYLSVVTKRPIKWFNSRTEDMMTTNHGRDMRLRFKAAFDSEGKLLGIEGTLIHDLGAPFEDINRDSFWMTTTAARLLIGRYKVNSLKIRVLGVATNKAFIGAYRGAGRPEATYFIERILTLGARELGLDQYEVRERNVMDDVNFTKLPTGLTYDSGKYKELLRIAKPYYNDLIKRRDSLRSKGKLAGVGVAIVSEIASFGPYSTAKVKVLPNGRIQVITGTTPHGQGDATAFTQIAAEVFDVDPSNVDVLWGDTDLISDGDLTAGSRTITVGGSAVYEAAVRLKEKLLKVVSEKMGVRAEEIEYREGKFIHEDKTMSLWEAARTSMFMGVLPEQDYSYVMNLYTSPYGVHMVLVEVDRDTGFTRVLDYKAFDDVGVVVNPLLAEGQTHGGALQGIGQALYEEAVYSQDGNLLTSNFSDYVLPTAVESFNVEWKSFGLTKSDTPIGSKGIGELPTIAGTPAVVSAIEDAIGKKIYTMPVKPELVLKLLGE
ncbi:xanthine dehydrogenase family protein molybdopterin-binding subunit [Sulfolobus acidocaldarius]|uniref:Carbon monoxide dehydrogenase large chain n=4 Tax=Sulfolobus acidocaldarius TaxID=2285 RepID=Q4J719_SULAC|nr:xanthine dehydrogenase family protein molybdopterin-binding subunit [Sulfolobus acidocaldarius]AAY81411.1 carbon monoxide dehydrogenase large chain [Sulfolobus acidocaldarius DSM 639]AGE72010.1 carbon monoxide dehydrogenase large chain [Sulfolobus acidocaldarius N8]AGE74327.1 carbon monoxide dehydrogenase large chain [Sulfolobus acidocaldarius Ron12/I]ALU29798.1 aldehyde oxidase [Sulfolobus acidocaldarius]ALU32537.1 aldehyde oxidase [Sulfolobus acidocaldarius]